MMEGEIYAWIKNIVIYMILNTIIMNLLGNKSYKKYVSIASGMILVLIVVSPLAKLLKLEDNLDYFLEANDFAIDSSDFKNEVTQVEEEQSDAIFSEYENKIKTQVKELLLKENVSLNSFHVKIDKNPDSSTFGEITGMDITGTVIQDEDETTKERLQIDQIEISQIAVGEEDKEVSAEVPSPMEINIKNKLSDFYNTPQGNINISIQGG
jgi:stage III sporulation protein AF